MAQPIEMPAKNKSTIHNDSIPIRSIRCGLEVAANNKNKSDIVLKRIKARKNPHKLYELTDECDDVLCSANILRDYTRMVGITKYITS